ncbi:ATP-dependent DNA helicase RecG [Colwellia sp. 4_MG-2023]|jgi:ATP-dependent DNA helicase RecG|uniref:ATP-dependent DNA helicase RecG n=1 Tax=unclassified Colwellia TaxID=196834 RepID=UPI001C09D79F|nr:MULTISPECIES: ATP-dependent DNA helicase RecG [unclassified Colwellia]MBU2923642.1 ATP-dependent DNA helicase RecG [Colwellia sp. C2M11]MDO6505835.1 ATP-dependent DNA helicase RecG [Colwellia sp. 5_MG-2023]MDO6554516.1 ATP-dependent DNA helicase RecG [Colwellia sp. 4_MG-2023]MDO6652258.1 ATP-dependent DNA helicase RecG [Colwellia sp. 3_MG-2023]MDO6664573.1 ATP-dependent DNA helicase RecG [Colwellia sp. 2_MG-2023]
MEALTQLSQVALSTLKGVGPSMAAKLEKLGLLSVQDLLFHLPLRYEDRTRISTIRDCLPGTHTNIIGDITDSQITHGKRRMLVVTLNDGTSDIQLCFFSFSASLKNSLSIGRTIRCYGEIKRGPRGYQIVHPEYKSLDDDRALTPAEETLTPVYPTTDGLKQISLRNLTDQALIRLQRGQVEELLPTTLFDEKYSLAQALAIIHRPPPEASTSELENGKHPAQVRLIKEELLAHNLSMLKLRQNSDVHQAIAIKDNKKIAQAFLKTLPFSPTNAQSRVVNEIKNDLAKAQPMMRLVQGDVGSGKTLVAALAALDAIKQGYQVALMAPTEILAEQHAINFANWFNPLDVSVGWLAGKTKAKARRLALEKIASGEMQMVIGTHALFQAEVIFNKLVLIIIDEQHKFGVHQRLSLREKGVFDNNYPHQLIMTATPIPRTLAMTAYADLDTSVIDELPPGRTPINTVALPDTRRDNVIERIREGCVNDNRQAYWVCTLIEESEVLQCQAAEDTAIHLQEQLPELKVGLVHGRMKADEKQAVMDDFKAGKSHLLIATTVIEVGVDVPNASLMVIENPERLGLAQLHQLRGRVGRGSVASHCVLLYKAPLSKTATKRLAVLRESNDGFVIAEKDLEIRGPGELLGTRQTGLAELRIADLIRDGYLIPDIKQKAYLLSRQNPECAQALIQRWLGNKERYSNA